jgi:uncharacterized protein
LDVSLSVLLVGAVVTFVAAALQSTIGFGFAIVSVPILALVDSRLVPVPQLLMALPLVSAMAWRERHAVDLRGVGWILGGRALGSLVGIVMIKVLSDNALEAAVGILVLVLAATVSIGITVRLNPATQFSAGTVSGVAGMIAYIGGPPLALLYRNHPGARMRSSLSVVFLFGLVITISVRVAASEITTSDLATALLLLPAMLLGFRVAGPFLHRIEERVLRNAVIGLSVAAGVALTVRAVLA